MKFVDTYPRNLLPYVWEILDSSGKIIRVHTPRRLTEDEEKEIKNVIIDAEGVSENKNYKLIRTDFLPPQENEYNLALNEYTNKYPSLKVGYAFDQLAHVLIHNELFLIEYGEDIFGKTPQYKEDTSIIIEGHNIQLNLKYDFSVFEHDFIELLIAYWGVYGPKNTSLSVLAKNNLSDKSKWEIEKDFDCYEASLVHMKFINEIG